MPDDGDRQSINLTFVKGNRDPSQMDEVSRKILEHGPQSGSGTSIFDPVLCELLYRWFCPEGGIVLDPFAGGSVRGIVAGRLGRRYIGVDLSARQIEANRAQARVICAGAPGPARSRRIKISAASLRQQFHPCTADFIATTCHARCCESSTSPTGTMITIHPSEERGIAALGGVVIDGMLQPRPGERRCPFKTAADLCGLHGTPDKPFGCIASPFTLSPADTLIVRNRYRALKCFKAPGSMPAYRAHRRSLDLILGPAQAAEVCDGLDAGGGDVMVEIAPDVHRRLHENDAIKRGANAGGAGGIVMPEWVVGDSRELPTLLSDDQWFDFVFSCPPYADLERYSDDPADLSTMDYPAFLDAYRTIIALACARLRPDRFAAFVVGDVRDRGGFYHGLPWHTIEAFEAAGLRLYNEAVLVTAIGSLPLRAGKQFIVSRKLGRTHQSVLVFIKGDPRRATKACGDADFADGIEPGAEPGPFDDRE